LLPTVRLQSDIGILELRTDQILRITFARDGIDSSSQDLVQLHDKSILRGQVQTHEFPVRIDAAVQSWPRSELLERFLDTRDTSWAALVIGLITLTLMEIVLGIDNIIFLAIVVGKLPPPQQSSARRFGLAAALGMRLILLLFLFPHGADCTPLDIATAPFALRLGSPRDLLAGLDSSWWGIVPHW
jgi:hypothetical protein